MPERRTSPAATLVLGVIIGLLLAGLGIPLVAGKQGGIGRSTSANVAAGGEGAAAGGADGSAAGADSGAGAASASGASAGGGAASAGGAAGAGSRATSAGGGTATGGPGGAKVYDQGVTDTSIKVGFLLYDVAGAGRAGFTQTGLDPKQQRAGFEAYVDEINRAGGINGRKIQPVFTTFDILSEDTQRSACLTLTEDQKVFALIGTFFFRSAYLCATKEHHRVLLALGSTATGSDVYADSGGLLFTSFQAGDRMLSNLAAELDGAGMLKGATVGILSDDGFDPRAISSNVLEARIKQFGGKVGRHAHLSADMGTASSQIPLELQQMRSAGVSLVLLLANPVLSTQFVQLAANQGYNPRYTTSDWAGMSSQPGQGNMPQSYNGTRSFTGLRVYEKRAGMPDTPEAVHCRQVYEAYTHKSVDRDTTEWGVAMGNCNFLKLFAAGVAKAGNTLTSDALSAALQSLGPFPVAQWGEGSFRPGKFDFIDAVRQQHWDTACSCLVPDGPFHRTKY